MTTLEQKLEDFPDIVYAWFQLCMQKECFFCSKKYPDGLVIKMPGDTETPLQKRIKSDYLFHVQDTHGYSPEIFISMLREVITNVKNADSN